MKTSKVYFGTINGFRAITNGTPREDMIVEEEKKLFFPDDGMVFQNKKTKEMVGCLEPDAKIKDWEEVPEPVKEGEKNEDAEVA